MRTRVRARAEADASDRRRAAGEATGPLDGLPVGIQIIGRQYDDRTCLHMAGLIEEGHCRFAPPPGY